MYEQDSIVVREGVYPDSGGESIVATELYDEMGVGGQCIDSGFRQLALVRKCFQVRRNDICSDSCDLSLPLNNRSVVYSPKGVKIPLKYP